MANFIKLLVFGIILVGVKGQDNADLEELLGKETADAAKEGLKELGIDAEEKLKELAQEAEAEGDEAFEEIEGEDEFEEIVDEVEEGLEDLEEGLEDGLEDDLEDDLEEGLEDLEEGLEKLAEDVEQVAENLTLTEEMQGAEDSHYLLYKMTEVTEAETMKRFPKSVIDGIPADVISDLSILSTEGDALVAPGIPAPWLSNEKVKKAIMEKKTIQTSKQIFQLVDEMSLAEIHSLPWEQISIGIHPKGFEGAPVEAIRRMPFEKIWTHLNADHSKYIEAKAMKAIHPTRCATITPEVLGGFETRIFGEIPIECLNSIPAPSFQYVTVKSWRQLGPRKFSVLREDILNEISKQVYEELGRSFLSRVQREQLIKIQKVLPTLPNDRPPKPFGKGEVNDARSVEEKLDQSIVALTEVAKMTRKDLAHWAPPEAHPLDEKFLYEMPTESLMAMRTNAGKSLPKNFWLGRERRLQSTARQMFKHFSVNELENLQWEEVTEFIYPSTFNSMSPHVMKSVPWPTILSKMTGEQSSLLTARTISMIEPYAFESLGKEAFSGLTLRTLEQMTEEQFKAISADAFEGFTLEHLRSFGHEKVEDLSPEKRARIDWTSIVDEMDNMNQIHELTEEGRQSLDWNRILKTTLPKKLNTLSRNPRRAKGGGGTLFGDGAIMGVGTTGEFIESSGVGGESVIEGSETVVESIGESVIEGGEAVAESIGEGMVGGSDAAVESIETVYRGKGCDCVDIVPAEAFQELTFKKFKKLSKDFKASMTQEQVQSLDNEIFEQLETIELLKIGRDFMDNMSEEQRSIVNLDEFIQSLDINEVSTDMLPAFPPESFKELSFEKLTTFDMKTFQALSQEQLDAMKWKELMPEIGRDKLNLISDRLWTKLPKSAMKGVTQEQFIELDAHVFEILSEEQIHSFKPEHFKTLTVEQLEGIGVEKLKNLYSSHTNAIPKEVLIEAGVRYYEAANRQQEVLAFFQYQRQQLYQRMEAATAGTSGETVMEVFDAFTEQDFRQFNWKKFAREIHSHQINSLSEEIIHKARWEKMFPAFRRSTVESISVKTWEKIPADKFKYMTIDIMEVLSARTIGGFSEEQLAKIPDELFKEIDGRSLIRIGPEKFASLSLEKLKHIKPKEFRSVTHKMWEELGEEKYKLLDDEIQENVNERIRKRVTYLKKSTKQKKIERKRKTKKSESKSERKAKTRVRSISEARRRSRNRAKHRRRPTSSRRQTTTSFEDRIVPGVRVRCISRRGCTIIP